MSLTLRHQIQIGLVTVATPGHGSQTRILHIAVVDVVTWLIQNDWPQIVLIMMSELLIVCGVIYERYWIGFPSLYVEAIVEAITMEWWGYWW